MPILSPQVKITLHATPAEVGHMVRKAAVVVSVSSMTVPETVFVTCHFLLLQQFLKLVTHIKIGLKSGYFVEEGERQS